MKGHIVTGTYTGTGAALNLELGFIPDYFRTINITDGNAGLTWFNGMADGTAIAEGAALASQASNGITTYAGSEAANSAGLTIGTAASVSAKVYRYVAIAGQ